jgi:hypothetical protein
MVAAVAVLAALGTMVLLPAVSRAEPQSDSFAGVWQVTVTPDSAGEQAGKQKFGDLVLFEGGKFTASACAMYGFAPADYSLDNNGSTFSATMLNAGESLEWSASVGGQGMSGSVVWTKADGSVFRYTLSGSRQHEEDEGGEQGEE